MLACALFLSMRAGFPSAGTETGITRSMFEISEIKCEYRKDPIGIDSVHPRLFWKVSSDKAVQTAYRVVVSATAEGARRGEGDMWDSGKVESRTAFCAEYAGVPLASRTGGYWKVTVFADGESAESEVGYFETGLLQPQDWQGCWTSMPAQRSGSTSLFRRELELESGARRVRAYVCCAGFHEVYFNGKKVGNALLNAAITDPSRRIPYCTYDLTPLCRAGKNVFGLEVAHGWYGSKQALVQIYADLPDGRVQEFHSSVNGGWYVASGATVETSIYDGEIYDARIEENIPRDWTSPQYEARNTRGWMPCVYWPAPQGAPQAQAIEEEGVDKVYQPVSSHRLETGEQVFDIGKNIAGRARIRVRGARGSRIVLRFGERLCEDGSVNFCNLRSAKATDIYILRGQGEEEFAPRFTFHGFQYVQVRTEGECELLSLQGECIRTLTRESGSFSCSDEELNRLHEMAVITEKNNQQGILTDCPQRDERFGWLNDLSSRLYQTVYNFGMERFFPKFVRDIAHTQTEDGAIADTAPFFTGGRPADPVSAAYLMMPVLSYRLYGDTRCAKEEYEGCKKWVEFLLSRSEGYLMNYSYYADWVAPACFKEHTDNLYVSSVFLFWQLRLLAQMARIAGKSADARLYASKAEACAKAVHAHYFDAATGHYANGTQTADALALSLGIVPESERARVAAGLKRMVESRGYHSACGNIGYRHLFYALGDFGYTDIALKMLKNPEYPGWGYMLANGATSVWERWESEMSSEMDSFNHPMFGSYDAFFYHYLAGIRVDEDACACDKVTVCPTILTSLTEVRASVDTVRGKISSEWKRENGRVVLRVSIPHGVTADILFAGRRQKVGCGTYEYSAAEQEFSSRAPQTAAV